MFAATKLQVATYLLGVCPFSIAFLVFLNSSVSFVVTDLIGQREKVGDAVGSLGFADELLAVVACPLWGLLSDRIGVRYVCVLGYLVISLALVLFVQAHNVYPQLLLGRLLFSLGGAAASTMVTAVLPAVSAPAEEVKESPEERDLPAERTHVSSPSLTSEITITPTRYQANGTGAKVTTSTTSSFTSTSRVAGFVGMLTGCGALIALLLFLPLPARFQNHGMTPERALQHSFYIVAAVAFVLSLWCFVGLRNLQHEQDRAGTSLKQIRTPLSEHATAIWRDLAHAISAGFRRSDIALGYAGGFVARASSVGISLFIPLLVNALFLSSHLCDQKSVSDSPAGLPDIKKCPRAYVVAAEMTGVCEMVALVAAPVFGYVSSRSRRRGLPMMMAAVAGIIGYPLFATQFDPDSAQTGKRVLAFLAVSLIGISQIGAIVCSLGILSNGVLSNGIHSKLVPEEAEDGADGEGAALLGSSQTNARDQSLTPLKGSVAGVYSFYGGAAILFLTKVGGLLFDKVSFGAPFYIMAAFNTVLLVACGVLGARLTV
jgi:MFS family permease